MGYFLNKLCYVQDRWTIRPRERARARAVEKQFSDEADLMTEIGVREVRFMLRSSKTSED